MTDRKGDGRGDVGLDEYGKRAFEFIAAVSAATSRDEIVRLTMAELGWFGLTFVTSWSIPAGGAPQADCVDFNTRPEAYAEHYLRHNLLWRDPVINAMRATLTTLSWSDVRSGFGLTKAEHRIVDEARDFGAKDGLTIPVFSEDGGIGVFTPCGDDPDLTPRAKVALELIGLYAHQALQRAEMTKKRAKAAHIPLTPREREVMRWVAIGKTNDEIAAILAIGTATVKTILARAQSKLDATRRTYAVVQALRLGELDMNF